MPEIYLVVTIDVEPDCSPSWHYSDPLEFKGVTQGIGEILTPLFKRYSIVPTYLINNVVLEDDRCISLFKSLNNQAELGTHLHPEFIMPQQSYSDYAGRKGEANCCFYPPDIESAKLVAITELFTKKIGYKPTSFRAGRFSAGKNTIKTLAELKYLVDTSVTPGINWNDKTRESEVNYTSCSHQPYWTNRVDFPSKARGIKTILEVPVTILEKHSFGLRNFGRFIKTGSFKSFYQNNWLRPKFSEISQLKDIATTLLTQNEGKGKPTVLNMMFHNVEVMPGLSPYSLTQQDADQYLASLENFLQFCVSKKIQGLPLSALYGKFQ